MNQSRILRSTNLLLLLTGYQLYWFESKSRRWRLSIAALLHVLVLSCVYIACFAQHFETPPLLKMLEQLSPFLYQLTQMQILVGFKIFFYTIYASARAMRSANGLVEHLRSDSRGFSKAEALAYFLLFSTLILLLIFGLYIAYEMEFKLPPLEYIMVGLALFIPHFVLSGALRFYNILAWLSRLQFQRLSSSIIAELCPKQESDIELLVSSSTVAIALPNADALEQQRQQLELMSNRFRDFFAALQKSLMSLFVANFNCLLAGVYSYVYFDSTWKLMIPERKRRVFLAGNYLIYACIGCDYICLLLTHKKLQQTLSELAEQLHLPLSQREALPRKSRAIVEDMRDILSKTLDFKFSLWRFDVAHFALFLLLQGLIIALFVTYHYLNDAVVQLTDRLDAADIDDD